jgi:ZIP family zinc transporter
LFTLAETLLFSSIMGLSIFLSLPVIMHRRAGEMTTRLLTAVAIGILVFLLGDIFSNVSQSLYNGSLYGYGSSPINDLLFTIALVAGFLLLYYAGDSAKQGLSPYQLGLMISLGMGFQNLTEGLVFGALGVKFGLTGAALAVLVGFILQNITEGFPIASPFLGKIRGKIRTIVPLFLIGGIPAIIGGGIGFYYNSIQFDLIFDGIAIGCILYAILPMMRMLFREADHKIQRIGYLGIFLGFILGFLVNLA